MGIKNYSRKEIFGMQPTNYEFLDKIADVFLSQRACGNNNELIDTVSFYDNKMSSIVYDYYPFEVEIRDNNLYFFIITNRSEKKMLFSSSLNTDFDKLCDSLIKCITTDVKKQNVYQKSTKKGRRWPGVSGPRRPFCFHVSTKCLPGKLFRRDLRDFSLDLLLSITNSSCVRSVVQA